MLRQSATASAMFKSREEREYDAEIDALAREKELVRAEAAALAAEKRHRRYERTDMPLVSLTSHAVEWQSFVQATSTRSESLTRLLDLFFPPFQCERLKCFSGLLDGLENHPGHPRQCATGPC